MGRGPGYRLFLNQPFASARLIYYSHRPTCNILIHSTVMDAVMLQVLEDKRYGMALTEGKESVKERTAL